MKKPPSPRAIQVRLKNDLEAATSRAVHAGLPFTEITRVVLREATKLTAMMELAQRLDREKLTRRKKKGRNA